MEIEQGTCMRYLAKLVSGSNLLYNIKERKGGNQKKIDFPVAVVSKTSQRLHEKLNVQIEYERYINSEKTVSEIKDCKV